MRKQFVHMLLFECPRCGGAIATTVTSEHGSPEETDKGEIALRCTCKWSGQSLGLTAKRHFVIDWEQGPAESGPAEDFGEGKTVGTKRGWALLKGTRLHLASLAL
jgi:hypothetical protein